VDVEVPPDVREGYQVRELPLDGGLDLPGILPQFGGTKGRPSAL